MLDGLPTNEASWAILFQLPTLDTSYYVILIASNVQLLDILDMKALAGGILISQHGLPSAHLLGTVSRLEQTASKETTKS